MTIQDTVLTELAPQPYAAIRDRIRDGDVLLCSANDFGSRMIRWPPAVNRAIAPSPSGCARAIGCWCWNACSGWACARCR